ncbi:hypothetical protein MtrunA17_Chr1g0180461 [Medicago truncatula]|uniref:Uncharacterized protein n=1 Tax=Medicago truncatula TaxID=3880 RepID=A0A396JU45_MEDTR|nr:hypothetical protein MtrunA17_Chr1g0180461 [Medicago truncatula]
MKASGDIRTLPTTLFLLVKKNWSSEIRLHAFKMLQVQHLVRLKWEELSPKEHKNFAKLSIDLMYEIADPCEDWTLKSQTLLLILSHLQFRLAELVSMMLRWLSEDITVHNEDLEGL